MVHRPQWAIHLLLAFLVALGLVVVTPELSMASASSTQAAKLQDNINSQWSGFHIVRHDGNITKVHGEWAIPCESKSYGYTYGGHGTWIGLGGINSSASIKVGSAVDLRNGSNSYLWYEAANGVIHVLQVGLNCGTFYPVYIRATLYLNQYTGSYRYDIIATRGISGK